MKNKYSDESELKYSSSNIFIANDLNKVNECEVITGHGK